MTESEDQQTPAERAANDLAYVREAIEYQRRIVGQHLPPSMAALVALYLLVAVGSRYYLDDPLGDMVGKYSTLIMIFIYVTFEHFNKRKKAAQCDSRRISARALRKMILPALGMFASILVLVLARSELGLIGDPFRVAGLLVVGVTMLNIGANSTATATALGLGMLGGALAIVYGQYMLLGASLAGAILIGSWIDHKRARALDA